MKFGLREHKTLRGFSNFRINLLQLFFFLAFLLINARLFSIQVLSHEKYEKMAQEQYWDFQELPARRGDVLTSDGYVLAGTQTMYLLYAEPKKIENKYKTSHDLAQILSDIAFEERLNVAKESSSSELPERNDIFADYISQITESLSKDLFWVPIQKNITPDNMKKIESIGIKGLGFENTPARYYPEGTLASHILGFVGSDERGQKIGYFGIEGRLNEDLMGKSGRIMEETDATGSPILTGGYKKVEPLQGRNIILTINRAVQYLVEKKIKEGVEKFDAVSGSVVVMDPMTGEVLAMANYPTYDPKMYSEEDTYLEGSSHRKVSEKRNLAISYTYEPGSVMKPFTIASAIDLKLISPTTTFEDNGPVMYSGHYINNWDGKHHSTQTIIELLQKSNNIGAAWVGHQVGAERLHKYLFNFGLGTKTGVDLEGEDTGYIRPANDWTDIDLATTSFGQSISATPLQVLNGFNVLANGGYLLEPKVISKIVDEDREIVIPSKSVRRVVSKETSDTMIDLLEKAAEGGEAKYFVLKNYKIAGKTGTAQIAVNGKYAADKTNATFVGFLSGSKKISMIVRIEEPQTSIYAAETAVPLWMEIVSELVKFYGIAPDKEVSPPVSVSTSTQGL